MSQTFSTLNNGITMPALGLGVFQSAPQDTTAAVQTALETGYRLIDTAAAYGNERQVGAAVNQSGVSRSDVFVTTKLWVTQYGYEEALQGFETSLRKLALDFVDLYLLHWPVPSDFQKTLGAYRAAEKLLQEGRVRAIGVSNFSVQHLEQLKQESNVVPAVNQVELHPFFVQSELQEYHKRQGILTQAWSPIGGVYNRKPSAAPESASSPLTHASVVEIANRYKKTPAQVVLRWHLQQGISAIPKSVKPERIAENFDVFDFTLTEDEITAIHALDTGNRAGGDPEAVAADTFPIKIEPA